MWLARVMAPQKRLWGFDDAEREVLSRRQSSFRRCVRWWRERSGVRICRTCGSCKRACGKLDEVYSLVEALMDETENEQRLEQLEGMLATLCTSMDGF